MTDGEKNDHLQEFLSLLKERECKAQQKLVLDGRLKGKISFEPRGVSTPMQSHVIQAKITTSKEYLRAPGGGFKGGTQLSILAYGRSGSSTSTDRGTSNVTDAVRGKICSLPEDTRSLSINYPGYATYPCPYKQRSTNATSSYYPSRNKIYTKPKYAVPAYQSSYPISLNATAQTSFYEVSRGRNAAEYYEDEAEVEAEVDVFNTAFIDYDPNPADYEEDDTQERYTEYRTTSGNVICACR